MLFNKRLAIRISEQEISESKKLFQDRSTSGWYRSQHGWWWKVVIPSTVNHDDPYGGLRIHYEEETGKKTRLEIYHFSGLYTLFHNCVIDATFGNWNDLEKYLRKSNQRYQLKHGFSKGVE